MNYVYVLDFGDVVKIGKEGLSIECISCLLVGLGRTTFFL
jgi:hypothetical protein